MMEPLTPAVIAVATLILNKAFEKTGEKLGEAISSQAGQLMQLIKRKPLPKTGAIEKADQPIDFGEAVIEVEAVSSNDAELKEAVGRLAAIVKADPQLAQLIPAYATALQQSQPSTIQNYGKLADEIKNVFQGNTFNAPVTFN
jgi:hypothetical protein